MTSRSLLIMEASHRRRGAKKSRRWEFSLSLFLNISLTFFCLPHDFHSIWRPAWRGAPQKSENFLSRQKDCPFFFFLPLTFFTGWGGPPTLGGEKELVAPISVQKFAQLFFSGRRIEFAWRGVEEGLDNGGAVRVEELREFLLRANFNELNPD